MKCIDRKCLDREEALLLLPYYKDKRILRGVYVNFKSYARFLRRGALRVLIKRELMSRGIGRYSARVPFSIIVCARVKAGLLAAKAF